MDEGFNWFSKDVMLFFIIWLYRNMREGGREDWNFSCERLDLKENGSGGTNMILYKYLNCEGALKTAKNNSVLLKCPTEYNDPFDGLFYVDEINRKKAFEVFGSYLLLSECLKATSSKGDPAIRKLMTPDFLRDFHSAISEIKKSGLFLGFELPPNLKALLRKVIGKTETKFNRIMDDCFNQIRNDALVSCFGSTYDSVLMWSHYGESHKGACFEFEVEDSNFQEVRYSKEMVSFDLAKSLEVFLGHKIAEKEIDYKDPKVQFVLSPLLTKSKDWEYEGERRCVFSKKGRGKIPGIYEDWIEKDKEIKGSFFRMPEYKAIYVGCNASEDFISELSKYSKQPPKRMKKLAEEYGLVAE